MTKLFQFVIVYYLVHLTLTVHDIAAKRKSNFFFWNAVVAALTAFYTVFLYEGI